jgi:putative peptidoglycan lipid II flippase
VNDESGVRHSVSAGLRMMLMLNIPATVGLVVLATPIVALIYQHGRFTAEDTQATAAALMYYAPGLVGYSAVKLFSTSFYALGNSRLPVVASAASVVINMILSLILVRVLGHRGLALATAIAALCNAIVLFIALRKRLHGLDGARVLVTLAKVSAASVVMAAAARAMLAVMHSIFGNTGTGAQAAAVFVAIAIGLAALAATSWLLRVDELTDAIRAVVRSR